MVILQNKLPPASAPAYAEGQQRPGLERRFCLGLTAACEVGRDRDTPDALE